MESTHGFAGLAPAATGLAWAWGWFATASVGVGVDACRPVYGARGALMSRITTGIALWRLAPAVDVRTLSA